jgi:hypothetical protein
MCRQPYNRARHAYSLGEMYQRFGHAQPVTLLIRFVSVYGDNFGRNTHLQIHMYLTGVEHLKLQMSIHIYRGRAHIVVPPTAFHLPAHPLGHNISILQIPPDFPILKPPNFLFSQMVPN